MQERWIQVLVATEVLLLLTALLTRKRTTLQFFIFALAGELSASWAVHVPDS